MKSLAVDSRVPVARSHPHATSAVYPPASPARRILQHLFEARGRQSIRRDVFLPLHWDQLARSFGQKFYLHGGFIWLEYLTRWLNILQIPWTARSPHWLIRPG